MINYILQGAESLFTHHPKYVQQLDPQCIQNKYIFQIINSYSVYGQNPSFQKTKQTWHIRTSHGPNKGNTWLVGCFLSYLYLFLLFAAEI